MSSSSIFGLMQDAPLLISSVIEHAALYHSKTEIVSRTLEGPIVRTNWGCMLKRVKKLANVLTELGVKKGDRIGTLAWNTYRHLELYFAVGSIGAILHTINARLSADQLLLIMNHAEDKILFLDTSFIKQVEGIRDRLTCEQYVLLTDEKHMTHSPLLRPLAYETLMNHASETFTWPIFPETTASSLCYTSGTTGDPKGVLYSHRSTILHAWSAMSRDGFGISAEDTILVVVPMFHVNAWGLPHAAAMAGSKIVVLANLTDGPTIVSMASQERATITTGVPTVWLNLFSYLDANPHLSLTPTLNRVVVGGTAPPRSMIERFVYKHNIQFIQIWGMTETSPIGCLNTPLPQHAQLSKEEKLDVLQKQGRGMFGLQMRVVDEHGVELPRDGKSVGQLLVRGPWCASGYFKRGAHGLITDDGWMITGDMATLDAEGYMQIADRAKDMIKSGGEWISSVDLENHTMNHPDVHEASVIGVQHPKWDERPLLLVVKKNPSLTKEGILKFLETRVAKWWLPDEVIFVDELPHQATGKVSKLTLRKQYKDFKLPQSKL